MRKNSNSKQRHKYSNNSAIIRSYWKVKFWRQLPDDDIINFFV